MSRTSPRSPPRTSPASGWSPAATPSWPPNAPASAKTCWPPPRRPGQDRRPGQAGRLKDPDKIGVQAGKVINKRKVAKHFTLDIAEGRITWRRDQASIDAEAAHRRDLRHPHPRPRRNPRRRRRRGRLQGPFQPRARLPLHQGRRPGPAADLPPARRPGPRPRADLHARLLPRLAPAQGLGTADLRRRAPARPRQPGRPARRSASADAKAARKTGPGKQPVRSFRDLIDHLATLTRNDLRYGQVAIPALAEPTPDQRRAFDLLGAPPGHP